MSAFQSGQCISLCDNLTHVTKHHACDSSSHILTYSAMRFSNVIRSKLADILGECIEASSPHG